MHGLRWHHIHVSPNPIPFTVGLSRARFDPVMTFLVVKERRGEAGLRTELAPN
jgi:hypothetical protein